MIDFGFLVVSHITNNSHFESLIECLQSILAFYSENQIRILFSGQTEYAYANKINLKYPKISYVFAPNAAITYALTDLMRSKYFKSCVIIHDSMKILKSFHKPITDKIEFLWHFTNHRVNWSSIKLPENETNVKNLNLNNYDDLIVHHLKKMEIPEFRDFALELYWKKDKWVGCFGTCMYIRDIAYLYELEYETKICSYLTTLNSNWERRVSENIFAIACQYFLKKEITSSYDGLYYDAISYHNNFRGEFIEKRRDSFER